MSRHRPRVSSAELLLAADCLAGAADNLEDECKEMALLNVVAWLRGEVAEREEHARIREIVRACAKTGIGVTFAEASAMYRAELERNANR